MELALAPDTLARWQFGLTTVYHYLFVPLTISLAAIAAGFETAWVRTGKEKYFHATKFWGKLLLINLAIGVATGLVQEFQFGMNWSDYSKFVGDVFGAPLAMEALIAFFFESTFIGLWIFGWDKLPKKLHCACIWMVAIGTTFSAYFILAANSWMQHPVGYSIDRATGVAHLNDIWGVLTQKTALVVFTHTMTSAFLTGGAFVVGIASYHLWKIRRARAAGTATDRKRTGMMRTSLRMGLVMTVTAGILTALSGDQLGKVMFEQQPMKMAAAEALWDTEAPAPFSIFAVGNVAAGHNSVELSIPGILSFLAHDDFHTAVPGIHETAKAEAAKYGGKPDDYVPNIFVTFWGFRLMIGIGLTASVAAAAGLWLTRKKKWLLPEHRTGDDEAPKLMLTAGRELNPFFTKWGWRVGMASLVFPLIANSIGWVFTEMGRQPWAVFGLFKTADSVSPGVSQTEMLISLIVLMTLYTVLGWINVRLMKKYAVMGPDTDEQPPAKDPRLRGPSSGGPGGSGGPDEDADKPLTFAY
ncbi:cytochrome ubiquinol oxidase subunit I [Streptomyces sp. NBC_01387]|uniref:cytochrome ubiquinol oxidase subunit I n=1 Tax=unclassified Streptomyces TaxID=2593676 RepID=UPI002023EE7B|nr:MULTISPECIES: cytochrome ubiquinol oxidase subunit I [unclassified Streptomyces]WSC21037.1 cytochrome ubiquinol oxidase subunit I [Streptomyces sp. NBC_01766]WSV55041.1 cytochrome ubiquinol oxidase subunit I [Streptomyces sp. NBC_01014]